MSEIISGTVIQRSFIGREASNIINIASVPLSELGVRSDSPNEIIAEVLGIPRSVILDEQSYRRVIDFLRGFPPDYFYPYWHPRVDRYFFRLYESLSADTEPRQLFSDFLATVGATVPVNVFLNPLPLLLDPEYRERMEVSPEVLSTAIQCLASRVTESRLPAIP
jgi:hypothetical protein